MKTKAQGLINACKWIEATYGRDALAEVLGECSPMVRDVYAQGIAINWVPSGLVTELAEKADLRLGNGTGKLAEAIGEAGARSNLKGIFLRLAFYLGKPEFLMKRVAGIWDQFNDEGAMHVRHFDERSCVLELTGLEKTHPYYCAILTGWARQVATAMGITNPIVRHAECRGRGDPRCIWEIRWT
jgi:predicted hydrocarbon binding protein